MSPALNLGSSTSSGNLAITATTINLNGGTITTNNGGANGSVTMTGAVNIGAANSTIDAGSGLITFTSTVAAGSNALTLESDGGITFNGGADSVTGTNNLRLAPASAGTSIGVAGDSGTLQITSTDVAALGSSFVKVFIGRSDGSGTLKTDLVSFAPTVELQESVGGSISIDGAVSDTAGGILFVVDSSDNISVGADVITNNNFIVIDGPATLGANVTFTCGSGTANFAGTLDASSSGAQGLAINGDAYFEDYVGATTPLSSLSVSGTTYFTRGLGGGTIVGTTDTDGGTGNQTYNGGGSPEHGQRYHRHFDGHGRHRRFRQRC